MSTGQNFHEGDVIRFGWNQLFGEPSTIMSIQSMVMLHDGELMVPVPFRTGPGKSETNLMRLIDLVQMIEDYDPDVIPISKVKGPVQVPMYDITEGDRS